MADATVRVVILCGPDIAHRNTCATLIRSGVDVAGICIADKKAGGLPLAYIRRTAGKEGIVAVASQVLARLLHSALSCRRERRARTEIFDDAEAASVLASWSGQWHHTSDYGAADTLDWLARLEPDVLVVHSPYWVGKSVRAIPSTGLVIGGHPGLTPRYRGSHSALWAIERGHPEDVGCTVFLLDEGADTGVILRQEAIACRPGDTFVTLGWKGMRRIAELQAEVVRAIEAGDSLPDRKPPVPPDSYFSNPSLHAYLRYRTQAKKLGMV